MYMCSRMFMFKVHIFGIFGSQTRKIASIKQTGFTGLNYSARNLGHETFRMNYARQLFENMSALLSVLLLQEKYLHANKYYQPIFIQKYPVHIACTSIILASKTGLSPHFNEGHMTK